MALTLSSSSTQSSSLFASIDMGTNSFKLLIVRTDPSGRFIPIHRTKHRVLLGRDVTPTLTPYSISPHSTIRALEALSDFHSILQSHHVAQTQTRCVATAAVRDAHNTVDFVNSISNNIGMKVDVLLGEEEARLGYLGVLQFLPVYDKLALTVDIGGGSTEFVVGFKGKSVFATSLNLGHVVLTQRFTNKDAVPRMREHIRSVIHESGVVERIKEHGFEIAVGSSGTIRAIDNAVFRGVVDGGKRGWGFSREELRGVVEMLCDGEGEKERVFKKRSEYIVAGAVLLEEIFEMLGVEEMKVSGYSLGEGVIAESLAKLYPSYYDLNANARWQSVMRLAMRFNGKKKMRSAVGCAGLAKDIFEGLRNCKDQARNKVELASLLIENDLEYLEAASLLHNIGLVMGKKGYHKQSYHIIMNGGHLCDYNPEEVKLIALLTRHHRKKFPKSDSFMENHEEENQKFIYLCAIIRISVALQQHDALKSQESSDVKNQHLPSIIQHIVDNTIPELKQETHNFKTVFEL